MALEILEARPSKEEPLFMGVHPSYMRLSNGMRKLFDSSIEYVSLGVLGEYLLVIPSKRDANSIKVNRAENRVAIACSSIIARLHLVEKKRLYFVGMSTEECHGVEGAYIFKM